jgi:hypothetical protein
MRCNIYKFENLHFKILEQYKTLIYIINNV